MLHNEEMPASRSKWKVEHQARRQSGSRVEGVGDEALTGSLGRLLGPF